MIVTSKGVRIELNSETLKQLEFGFSVKVATNKSLDSYDYEYFYLVEYNDLEGKAVQRYLGQMRSLTIEPTDVHGEKNVTISFSRLIRNSDRLSELCAAYRKSSSHSVLEFAYAELFQTVSESDYPSDIVHESLSLSPQLTITNAVKQLADTYKIDPSKVTISITG